MASTPPNSHATYISSLPPLPAGTAVDKSRLENADAWSPASETRPIDAELFEAARFVMLAMKLIKKTTGSTQQTAAELVEKLLDMKQLTDMGYSLTDQAKTNLASTLSQSYLLLPAWMSQFLVQNADTVGATGPLTSRMGFDHTTAADLIAAPSAFPDIASVEIATLFGASGAEFASATNQIIAVINQVDRTQKIAIGENTKQFEHVVRTLLCAVIASRRVAANLRDKLIPSAQAAYTLAYSFEHTAAYIAKHASVVATEADAAASQSTYAQNEATANVLGAALTAANTAITTKEAAFDTAKDNLLASKNSSVSEVTTRTASFNGAMHNLRERQASHIEVIDGILKDLDTNPGATSRYALGHWTEGPVSAAFRDVLSTSTSGFRKFYRDKQDVLVYEGVKYQSVDWLTNADFETVDTNLVAQYSAWSAKAGAKQVAKLASQAANSALSEKQSSARQAAAAITATLKATFEAAPTDITTVTVSIGSGDHVVQKSLPAGITATYTTEDQWQIAAPQGAAYEALLRAAHQGTGDYTSLTHLVDTWVAHMYIRMEPITEAQQDAILTPAERVFAGNTFTDYDKADEFRQALFDGNFIMLDPITTDAQLKAFLTGGPSHQANGLTWPYPGVFTRKVIDQYEAAETKKTTDLAAATTAKTQQAAANLALFSGAKAIVDAEKVQQQSALNEVISAKQGELTNLTDGRRTSIAQEFDANITSLRAQYSSLVDEQTAQANAAYAASMTAAQTYRETVVTAAQINHTNLLAATTQAEEQVTEAEDGAHLESISEAVKQLDNLKTQITVPSGVVEFYASVRYGIVPEGGFLHPISGAIWNPWAQLTDEEQEALHKEADAADKVLKMLSSLVEMKTRALDTAIKLDGQQDKFRENAEKAKERSDAALVAYNAADAQHKADIASAAAALAAAGAVVTDPMQALRTSATTIAGGYTLVTQSPDPTEAEKATAIVNYAPYVANEQEITTLGAQIAADQVMYNAETYPPVKNAKVLSLRMQQYYDSNSDQEATMITELQNFWNDYGAAMHAAAKTADLRAIGASGKGLIYDASHGHPHMLYQSKAKLDAQLDAAIAAVGTAFSTELVDVRANLDIAVSGADKLRTLITSRLAAYDTAVAKAKSDIMDDIAQKRGAMAQSAMDQKQAESSALSAHQNLGQYGSESEEVAQLQTAKETAATALTAAGVQVAAAKAAIMTTYASTEKHGFSYALNADLAVPALIAAYQADLSTTTSTHNSAMTGLAATQSRAQVAKNSSDAVAAASLAALGVANTAASAALTAFNAFLTANDSSGLDALFNHNWKVPTIDAIVGGLYAKIPQLRTAASSVPIGSPGILGGAAPPEVVKLSTSDLKSAPGLQHAVLGLSALSSVLAAESEIRIWF